MDLVEAGEQLEKERTKVNDLAKYMKGIDLVIGILPPGLSEEEKEEVYKEADEAGERQFGNKPGKKILLTESTLKAIFDNLGEKTARDMLGMYKAEVEETTLIKNPFVSPDELRRREKRREQLFGTKDVQRVVFGS